MVTLACEQAHRWFRGNAPAQAGKADQKNGAKREGKRRSAVGQEKQRDFIIQRANNILFLPSSRVPMYHVTVSL